MSCIVEVLMPLIIIVSCCLSFGVVFIGVFCVLLCLCVPGGCGGVVVVCVVGWCWRGGSPVAIPPSCTSLSRCSCLFGLCVWLCVVCPCLVCLAYVFVLLCLLCLFCVSWSLFLSVLCLLCWVCCCGVRCDV
jgi:hypothetical protein